MALIEMVMPKMGESIMEGTILTWLKKEGDTIEQDEAVLEVATDKVDTEVPATHAGILRQILVQAGEVVEVGKPIAIIDTDLTTPQPTTESASQTLEMVDVETQTHASTIESQINQMTSASVQLMDAPITGRFYSPLVLTIAREEGISMQELERIPGSGGDNRVTKKDILQYVQSKKEPATTTAQPVVFTETGGYTKDTTTDTESTSLIDETMSLIAQMKAIPKDVPTVQASTVHTANNEQPVTQDSTPTVERPVAEEPVLQTEPALQDTTYTQPDSVQPEAEVKSEEQPVQNLEQPPAITVPTQEPVVQAPVIKVAEPVQPVSSPAVSYSGRADIIEMDRMRKMIAQRMVDSKRIAPHVTSFVEADVTNIVFWRNRVKQEFKSREGDTITFTPVFIEAIARAIKDYPMINSSVEGDKIIVKKDINIGMAVALPTGNLIVPVIKNADQYNMVGLTKKVNDLARRARDNKLTADDLADGTFTMSNVGSFGNVMGTPIIVQPQVGIMAFGAIQKKPAVIETPYGDSLGIRQLMFLSHSYDHRVVDGSLGGMFVRRVADYLEAFDINRKIF